MSKIFIISGPSGCGKGTIIEALKKNKELNLYWAKSYTTRPKRDSDDSEKKYIFVSPEKFKALEKQGEILESNLFNNNWYGSSRSEIDNALNKNLNIIKDIDVNGGAAYRQILPEAVLIFISSRLEDIKSRLISRGQNTPEEIETRLETAKAEIEASQIYDYIVENPQNKLEKAIEEITQIILNSDEKITICRAKKNDIPEICQIHKETWLKTYTSDTCGLDENDILSKDFDSPIKMRRWEEHLGDSDYRLLVAKDKNKVVGFCGARKGLTENDFSVIYILTDYQRQGIGQRFAQEIFAWLGTDKPTKIELAECNEQAMKFYQKLSFTRTTPAEPLILTGGKKVKVIKMYKE